MASNRHVKAQQRADYEEPPAHWTEDICPGCHLCLCVRCGGPMAAKGDDSTVRCVVCGHVEETADGKETTSD